jgi:malonate decarboxylase delta subunit
MNPSTSLEQLQFALAGSTPVPPFPPFLVGVVGSGNLEVLFEPQAPGLCTFEVETSARGFEPVWAAVLHDFHQRHGLSGVRIAINDMGATPAVVSLRLQQGLSQMKEFSS